MGNITSIGSLYSDIYTFIGVATGKVDMGPFTGSTITDNTDLKDALQDLETAIEAGGSTFYSADGTLSGARTVTMDGNDLIFSGSDGNTVIRSDGSVGVTSTVKYKGPRPTVIEPGTAWFDTNTQEMIISVQGGTNAATGVWSLAACLGAIMCNNPSLTGTQTSGLISHGVTCSCTRTEEYTGYAWSLGGTATCANQQTQGAGTQTDTLVASGEMGGASSCLYAEAYNGTSWSAETAVTTKHLNAFMGGTGEASSVVAGGWCGAGSSCTDEYNGTSWSAGGAMVQDQRDSDGAGVATAMLAVSGSSTAGGSPTACAQEYNGAVWAYAGGVNCSKNSSPVSGGVTDAFYYGGGSNLTCVEYYNGTVWSIDGSLALGTSFIRGAGANNAAYTAGGGTDPDATQLYTYYPNGTGWFQMGTWSMGTPMLDNKSLFAGGGCTTNNMITAGGLSNLGTTTVSTAHEFTSGSWSSITSLPCAIRNQPGTGSTSAFVQAGGYDGSAVVTTTYEYNGSTWSAGGAMTTCRLNMPMTGTETSSLTAGGADLTNANCLSEEYNGTSWSAGGNLAGCRSQVSAAGTQSDTVLFGGRNGTTAMCDTHEEYNGTTWSAGQNVVFWACCPGGFGDGSSCAVMFGGNHDTGSTDAICGYTQNYNGTSWEVDNCMLTALKWVAQGNTIGSGSSGVSLGGQTTSDDRKCVQLYSYATFSGCQGVWSAGGSVTQGRCELAAAGTHQSGLLFGGAVGATEYTCTDEYDGNVWTAGGALACKRCGLAGAGTQTAGLSFGGNDSGRQVCTEEYNGTSWSGGGNLTTARRRLMGAGTQTSGLSIAGDASGEVTCTEEYNGSSWSAGGAVNTKRGEAGASGTQTAAGLFTGEDTAALTSTEEYNGTSWTNVSPVNIARIGGSGSGTQSAALSYEGRNVSDCTTAEEYNGISWRQVNSTLYAREKVAGFGTVYNSVNIGGNASCAISEEYNYVSFSATEAVWTSATARAISIRHTAGAGNQNAALSLGGYTTATCNCTDEYNGTSWSGGGNMIKPRYFLGATGTQSAALNIGGSCFTGSETRFTCTEEYDGSTWSAGGALGSARNRGIAAGTQTAGLYAFGYISIDTTCNEEYDGTAWSSASNGITARANASGDGSQTSALSVSGDSLCTEEWNGLTWSDVDPYFHCVTLGGAAAVTAISFLQFTGECSTYATETGYYNGISWTECNSVITARQDPGGAGTSSCALSATGYNGSNLSCVEEYTCVDFLPFRICYI